MPTSKEPQVQGVLPSREESGVIAENTPAGSPRLALGALRARYIGDFMIIETHLRAR
jgi:hypothetical protein